MSCECGIGSKTYPRASKKLCFVTQKVLASSNVLNEMSTSSCQCNLVLVRILPVDTGMWYVGCGRTVTAIRQRSEDGIRYRSRHDLHIDAILLMDGSAACGIWQWRRDKEAQVCRCQCGTINCGERGLCHQTDKSKVVIGSNYEHSV